jgi:hypothetical protein
MKVRAIRQNITQLWLVNVHVAISKCTFGAAENKLQQTQKTQKTKKVRPKTPKAFYKDDPTHNKSLWGGDVPFKKGPDCDILFVLMEAHG